MGFLEKTSKEKQWFRLKRVESSLRKDVFSTVLFFLYWFIFELQESKKEKSLKKKKKKISHLRIKVTLILG